MNPRPLLTAVALAVTAAALVAACSDEAPDTVTHVADESFPTDQDNPVVQALAEFTDETGIDVEILIAGDTGTMLSKAALTAGNPEGDVMWGVDNTFLSRAIDAEVFEPYEAAGLDQIPSAFTDLVPGHTASPVDFGVVCVNYDIAALDSAGLAVPESFADLARPEYASELVVENPATSSPGLAFLLATIATYGDEGWEQYWSTLRENGVEIVDGWSQAYYESFSWAGGDRSLVVSYGSSPPFEVLDRDLDETGTGVMEATCFRQVEFAGVLRGTDAEEPARRLVDFLISERFQREIPLNLFVFPANAQVELDPVFVDYATVPEQPLTIDSALIDERRTEWTDRWTTVATR
jgi:thiamine transport system substrate-binding protein